MARGAPNINVRTELSPPMDDANEEEVLEYLRMLERVTAYKRANDDLLAFSQMMMPHPDDPDNPSKSQYEVAKHHRVLSYALEKVERGELPRLIVTMPPRHGKSQLISKNWLAWAAGRNPYKSFAFATYNDDFSGDFGREVRNMFETSQFEAIFPDFELRKGSKSAGRLVTTKGGVMVFVGRGGSLTGRGFDIGVIDDPFKDATEADSQLIRDKAWEWFTKVFMSRQMTVGASVVITLTRWHEDDIVGRLTDPNNPHYTSEEADVWKIINCPFFAEEDDSLGREVGEVLWPGRFSKEFGEAQQRLNPRGFQSLYQQRPSAQEGSYFKKAWLSHYDTAPDREALQIYAASDHAVATAQHNDKTCMLIAGVDKAGDIYLLDCVWGRFDSQQQVDKMIELMVKWKPSFWWAEKQHMGQALGPFLRKKKLEQGVSCVIEEVYASQDKEMRARSIQGLLADKRVFFPLRGWWRLAAEDEMLKFPQGTYDDFVDALAWLGVKIQQMYAARAIKPTDTPARNTWGWWKKELAHQKKLEEGDRASGGW